VTTLPSDSIRKDFLGRYADATLTIGTGKYCCNTAS